MSERTPKIQNIIARNVLKEKTLNSVGGGDDEKGTPRMVSKPSTTTIANKSKITLAASKQRETKETLENIFKSKIPVNSHHASSHVNLSTFANTPVNRKTSTLVTESNSKMDSERRKANTAPFKTGAVSSRPDTLATSLFKANATITTTPSNKSNMPFTPVKLLSNSKNNKPIDVNPVWNGVDYTDMMLKKAEYGYRGPGYIVEFDCDPKYLKGLTIERGLWKITSQKSGTLLPFDLGPFLISQRIDEEKKTPAKMTPFDFKPFQFESADKSATIGRLNLDIHTKKWEEPKKTRVTSKKSLRWAENLESVPENNMNSIGSCDQILTGSPALSSLLAEKDLDCAGGGGGRTRKSMRRSYSTSDMNKFLMMPPTETPGDGLDEDNNDGQKQKQQQQQQDVSAHAFPTLTVADSSSLSSTMLASACANTSAASQDQSDEFFNVTYDKPYQSLAVPNVAVSNHEGVAAAISPSKVVNSSFMDSSSILAESIATTTTNAAATNMNSSQLPFSLSSEKMRQLVLSPHPSEQPQHQHSSMLASFKATSSMLDTHYESAMLKSLQNTKKIITLRYKLEPNTTTLPSPIAITSQLNYDELMNLADYFEWLGKYLKHNLLYQSS